MGVPLTWQEWHAIAESRGQTIDRLARENAKLRELVLKVEHYECLGCYECPHADGCDAGTLYDEDCAMSREIEREKRKLGIEVDGQVGNRGGRMSDEPLPCPFCGYEKPVVEVDEVYPRRAWVECPLCEAKGPTESIPCGMTEEEAAVDAWNDASWRDA